MPLITNHLKLTLVIDTLMIILSRSIVLAPILFSMVHDTHLFMNAYKC